MAGDSPSPNDSVIERTNVPELEIIMLQQQLNARVRAGTLSGPLLPENGKLCDKTQAKQREQEAFDAIALAKILPAKPEDPAARAADRAEDERILAFVRDEFKHIGDTPYMDFDHKAPTIERLRKLEAAYKRKWETAGQAAAIIEAVLREPIRPGMLLVSDGAFDYARLEWALGQQRKIEAALAGVPTNDADYADLADKVAGYRLAIVEGLQGGKRPAAKPPIATAPIAADEPAVPPPPPRPAPPPRAATTADLPPAPAAEAPKGWTPDPEREKQGRELDMMGPERRLQLLKEHEADPADPMAARIAASILRTHPEAFTPAMSAQLDAYAMAELGRDEGRLAKVPPKARLAMVKGFAARAAGTDDDEAAAAFAGTLAAGLLRQHPNAAGEVIANAPGDLKPKLTMAMLAKMTDDDLTKLPKEALHALYKEVQAAKSGDERRHLARLVRLMNKR